MYHPFAIRSLAKAITTWATTFPHGLRSGAGPGGFSHIQFHTRPEENAPEVQLTLRAAIVDGHAVIQVPELESSDVAPTREVAGGAVQSITTADSGREPEAVCEGCGVTGTVGRAARAAPTGETLEIRRFCASCWPEQSARYRARWDEEDRLWTDQFMRGRVPSRGAGPGMSFISATWHGTLELVEQIERSMIAPIPPSPESLARMAADIERHAPDKEGEMPFAVEAFIRRYGAQPG